MAGRDRLVIGVAALAVLGVLAVWLASVVVSHREEIGVLLLAVGIVGAAIANKVQLSRLESYCAGTAAVGLLMLLGPTLVGLLTT